jgi:hypothetical protein
MEWGNYFITIDWRRLRKKSKYTSILAKSYFPYFEKERK